MQVGVRQRQEASDRTASGVVVMNRWFGSRTRKATGKPLKEQASNQPPLYFYCLVRDSLEYIWKF